MPLAPAYAPRIAKVLPTHGCTLTALHIAGLTPNEMEALATKEIDLFRHVLARAEAKVLGVQESGLATLLRSTIKDIKPKLGSTKIDEQSIVLPYFMRTQRSYINANYFTIEGGAATPGAGTGNIPAHAWDLTLNLGSSWLKSDIEEINRYFLPGNHLYVSTWDTAVAKNAIDIDFTILGSVNADAGGVRKAKVTVVSNYTAAAFAALSADQQSALNCTFGVAQTGVNSVSNREAWCYTQPANLSKKIIVNWPQTVRFARIIDSEHERILKAILSGKVNEFQRGFVHTDIADQNKQQTMLEEDALLRTAFYGQRINENQTVEGYTLLPTIADPAQPDCPLEYKANALGFLTQLTDAQRVIDMNGSPLDLDLLFSKLYELKRHREADGGKVSVIDVMTDRWTAGILYSAMSRYYKAKYGVETVRYAKIGEKITHEGQVLWNYNIYDIEDHGVQMAVYHDQFFDDYISAFPATVGAGVDFKARARMLWMLDWSDITLGVGKTMSVKRKSPDPETSDLYRCVMTARTQEFNLRSQQICPMIDRPHRHLIIRNFSSDCPTVKVTVCNPAPSSSNLNQATIQTYDLDGPTAAALG